MVLNISPYNMQLVPGIGKGLPDTQPIVNKDDIAPTDTQPIVDKEEILPTDTQSIVNKEDIGEVEPVGEEAGIVGADEITETLDVPHELIPKKPSIMRCMMACNDHPLCTAVSVTPPEKVLDTNYGSFEDSVNCLLSTASIGCRPPLLDKNWCLYVSDRFPDWKERASFHCTFTEYDLKPSDENRCYEERNGVIIGFSDGGNGFQSLEKFKCIFTKEGLLTIVTGAEGVQLSPNDISVNETCPGNKVINGLTTDKSMSVEQLKCMSLKSKYRVDKNNCRYVKLSDARNECPLVPLHLATAVLKEDNHFTAINCCEIRRAQETKIVGAAGV